MERRPYNINETYYCLCGCEQQIKLIRVHKYRGIPNYISGHNPVWNKGMKMSEEFCDKVSQAKKNFKPTEEHLSKLLDGSKKRWADDNKRKEASEKFKGENNPFYGKEHSEEARKVMSEKKKGKPSHNKGKKKFLDFNLEKYCKCGCGERIVIKEFHRYRKLPDYIDEHKGVASKGKIITEEQRNRHSAMLKGKPSPFKGVRGRFTEEQRLRISSGVSAYMILHGNYADKKFKKGIFYSNKNNSELKYDSSYELKAFEILEQKEDILSYKKCDFTIDYVLSGKLRRYLPDIYITSTDGSSEIIEIKPEYQLDYEETKAKVAYASEYCKNNNIKFSIWTEKQLFV